MSHINVFERPLPQGWIYPCTVAEIEAKLREFPQDDIEGLWAVGLVPATRKDCMANARYYGGERPTVHIFSLREDLIYKQPAGVHESDVRRGLLVELEYGMSFERIGARMLCKWDYRNINNFVLSHVLPHEIGHHVHHKSRERLGLPYRPRTVESEQCAEAYAVRWCRERRMNLGLDAERPGLRSHGDRWN